MAWSPDGAWLATSDDRGGVWLWPRGAAPGRQLQRSTVAISTLAFSADSTTLVGGSHRSGVAVAARYRVAFTARTDKDVVDTWTDGQRSSQSTVAARCGRGASGAPRWCSSARWRAPADQARDVCHGREQQRRVGRARWHQRQRRPGRWRRDRDGCNPQRPGRTIAITPMAAGSRRERRRRAPGCRPHHGRHLTLRGTRRGFATRVRRHALLSSDGEGVVRRWDLDAVPISVLDGTGAPVERMAASRDGTQLATVDAEGRVAMWTLGDRAHPGPPTVAVRSWGAPQGTLRRSRSRAAGCDHRQRRGRGHVWARPRSAARW